MSPEKTKVLIDKYPKIFETGAGLENEPFSHYHFECDDGWFDLINTLCRAIQGHVDWKVRNMDKESAEEFQVVAGQVKEKFGSLRFYVSGGDDYIAGLITMAESVSGMICESCGDKATVRTTGWIKNICHSCHVRGNLKQQGFELK